MDRWISVASAVMQTHQSVVVKREPSLTAMVTLRKGSHSKRTQSWIPVSISYWEDARKTAMTRARLSLLTGLGMVVCMEGQTDQKLNKRKTQNPEASHYFHLIPSHLLSGWDLETAILLFLDYPRAALHDSHSSQTQRKISESEHLEQSKVRAVCSQGLLVHLHQIYYITKEEKAQQDPFLWIQEEYFIDYYT